MRHFFWLLFLRGILCTDNPLVIKPEFLQSWQGSCVLIPCEVKKTYKGQTLKSNSLLWYLGPSFNNSLQDFSGTLLHKSSMISKKPENISGLNGRVKFVGNLAHRNCSLKVSQLQKKDSGEYGARLYGSLTDSTLKWIALATVTVEDSPPKPNLEFLPVQLEEQRATQVICSVIYHCLDEPLRLTLGGLDEDRLAAQRMTFQDRSLKTVLRFVPTWKDHGKMLTCSLKHQNGSGVSQNSMTLNVTHAPKGVKVNAKPGLTVREGTRLVLECIYSSSYPDVYLYQWYKNHQQLNEQNRNKIEIYYVRQEDSGSYKCSTNNFRISMSEELTIDVQYPPKYTQVHQDPRGTITEMSHVILRCSSQGNPPVQNYTWYKDGEMLQHINQNELVFSDIKPRNSGIYYCKVQNPLGSAKSQEVTLDVQYAPRNVQLALHSTLPIKEGNIVTLNCSVGSSNPSYCSYNWYKAEVGGKETRYNYDKQLLTFPAPRESSSIYKCEACNMVSCISSAKVTVNVLFAPKAVKTVQIPAGKIKEGFLVQLRCEVGSANPMHLQYTWYKDKKRLVSPDSTLSIQNVMSKDAGSYECEANNTVGFMRSLGIKLNVQYGPRYFQVLLDSKGTVIEGKDVSLECYNEANPAANMYKWYRNREEMPWETSRVLLLSNVQVKHSGDYQCKASNIISEGASQPMILAVYYSKATVLKHTATGFGIALALVILLGLLLYILRRGKRRVVPGTGRTQRAASVFMKKAKQVKLCNNNNQPNPRVEDSLGFLDQGAEEAISYATIQFPPSVSKERTVYARINQPRPSSDPPNEAVVYSVLKKPRLPSKGDTKADYENVPNKKEEDLHYSSLVNLAPHPHPIFADSETDSESEESIQYASLKH